MASPKTPQIEAVEPLMRRIPEGWFLMGYSGGRDDEKPVHRVWVDAFEFAAYQTTNSDYAHFLKATLYPKPLSWDDPEFNHPKQPVVAVSWLDAMAYCQWLSLACGKRYRLPTEAEWERAARGGTGAGSTWSPQEETGAGSDLNTERPGLAGAWNPPEEAEGALYPWGDAPPEQLPNYANRWKNGPEPVGMYSPSAYGLYNLGDNVHEWCSDWYDAAYYAISPERNPQGPATGSRRASRGGSWRHHIKVTRTAARSSIPPEFKYVDYGFRVARNADAPNLASAPNG